MTEPRVSSSASATRSLTDHAAWALLAAGAGVVTCLGRPDPGIGVVAAFGSCMLVYTAVERGLEPKRQLLRAAALVAVAFLGVIYDGAPVPVASTPPSTTEMAEIADTTSSA